MFTHLLSPAVMTAETAGPDPRLVGTMLMVGITAAAVFVVARVVMTVVAHVVEVIMAIGFKIMVALFLGTLVMAPVMIDSVRDFFAA